MNALINKLFTPYLKKYFKNIEHLDLSIKDSKLKIDSLVPYYDMISKLLNLEKYNFKIESGLIKNIVIEFPINILKNNIRIYVKSIDFYISEIDEEISHIEEINIKTNNDLINNEFDLKSCSSPKSTNSSGNNSTLYQDESFYEKTKDDILANLIFKIENINIYLFNSNNIIKFELMNLIFSPCDLENEDFEFSETFIKGVNRVDIKYRKSLIIDKIKASLHQQLDDSKSSKMNSYFIKNLKICVNNFYLNKFSENEKIEPIITTKILLDNFLFDYDINDSKLLINVINRMIKNPKLKEFENPKKNINCNYINNYISVSHESILNENNIIENYENINVDKNFYNVSFFLNNVNINIYHNDFSDILICFVVNNIYLKLNTKENIIFRNNLFIDNINEKNEEKSLNILKNLLGKIDYDFNFDKIFVMIPVIENENIEENLKYTTNNINNYKINKKENLNSNIKIILKGNSEEILNNKINLKIDNPKNLINKKFSISFKIIDHKRKRKIFYDNVIINLQIYNKIYIKNLLKDLNYQFFEKFNTENDSNTLIINDKLNKIDDYIILLNQIIKINLNNVCVRFDHNSLFSLICTLYNLSNKINNLVYYDNCYNSANKKIDNSKILNSNDLNENIKSHNSLIESFCYYLKEKFFKKIKYNLMIKSKINNVTIELGEYIEANEKSIFIQFSKLEMNKIKLNFNKRNELDFIFEEKQNKQNKKKKDLQNNQILKLKFSFKLIIINLLNQNKICVIDNIFKIKKTKFSEFYFFANKNNKTLLNYNRFEGQEIVNIFSNFWGNETLKLDIYQFLDEKIKKLKKTKNLEIDSSFNSNVNKNIKNLNHKNINDIIFHQLSTEYFYINSSDLKINVNAYAYNYLFSLIDIFNQELQNILSNIKYSNFSDSLNNLYINNKIDKKLNNPYIENINNSNFISINPKNNNFSKQNSFFPNSFETSNDKDFSNIFMSSLFNCTGYILEINSLNDNITQILKPNEKIMILNRFIKINLSINDVFYRKNIDIAQIYLSLTAESTLNISNEDIKIDYLKIDLMEKENKNKKFFNLFYKYNNKTKNKIDFYIMDNVLILNNIPNLTYKSILHYIVDKSSEISSLGQFNPENYNLSISLIPSMKNKFNLVDEENPAPILAFLSDNLLVKNYLLYEVELEINYIHKKEVISISQKDENSLMVFKDDVISVHLTLKIPSDMHITNMIENSPNKILIYKSDDIKSIFSSEKYGSYMVKLFYKVGNNFRYLLVNLIFEEFLKSHLFQKKELEKIDYLLDENKLYGIPLKIVKILPDLEIRKFTDTNLFDFFFIPNEFCDKFPVDDTINEKNSNNIKYEDGKNQTNNIEFNEFICEFHNNLYQIGDNNSTYILNKSVDYSNNVKMDIKKIRIGIKFKENFLESSELKIFYENLSQKHLQNLSKISSNENNEEISNNIINIQEENNNKKEITEQFISFEYFCEILNVKFFNRYFFSKTINLESFVVKTAKDGNNQNSKDFIFSIKLFDEFFLFFRIKLKKYFNYIWSLTLSSFINFSIKNSPSIKNIKITSCEKIEVNLNNLKDNFFNNSSENINEDGIEKDKIFNEQQTIFFDFLNKYSNNFLIKKNIENLKFDKINNYHIPFDNIFRLSKNYNDKNFDIDLNDLQSFIAFVKILETNFKLSVFISDNISQNNDSILSLLDLNEYVCDFSLDQLFLNEKYQINSTYIPISNNSFNNKKEIRENNFIRQNKIFHSRLIHSPYSISEIYSERFNHKENFYVFIENYTDLNLQIFVKANKSEECLIDCNPKTFNEFILFSNLESFLIDFNINNLFNDEQKFSKETLSIKKDINNQYLLYLIRFGLENSKFRNDLTKLNKILLEKYKNKFYLNISINLIVNNYFVKIIQYNLPEKSDYNDNFLFNNNNLLVNDTHLKNENSSHSDEIIQIEKNDEKLKNILLFFDDGTIIEKKKLFSFNISNLVLKINYMPSIELPVYSKISENNSLHQNDFSENNTRHIYNFQSFYQKKNKLKLYVDKIFGNINFNVINEYSSISFCENKNEKSGVKHKEMINSYLGVSFLKDETFFNISFTNFKLDRHSIHPNSQFSISNLNHVEKNIINIIETKFLTDIKLDIEEIYNNNNNFSRNFYDYSNKKFDIRNFYSINKNLTNKNDKNIFYKLKMNFPFEINLTVDESIFNIISFFKSQLSQEYSFKSSNENKKQMQNLKLKKIKLSNEIICESKNNIFDYLVLPKIKYNTTFSEMTINDFSIRLNIEYKKGLNLTVKNSLIANKNKKIKDLICSNESILDEIKNTFFNNFFSNTYNLIKGTELFGNFNQFMDEIKNGLNKFKERPLTTGIFSLFYSSLRGGFNSFFGVGKSITKSISLNLIGQKNYSTEIYLILSNYIRDFLMNSPDLELIHFDIYNFFESILPKNLVVSLINKIINKKGLNNQRNLNLNIIDNLNTNNLINNPTNIMNEIVNFVEFNYILKINKNSSDFFIENILIDWFNYFEDNEKYEIKYIVKCRDEDILYHCLINKYFFALIVKNNTNILIPYNEIEEFEIIKNQVNIRSKNHFNIKIDFDDSKDIGILKHEILAKFKI